MSLWERFDVARKAQREQRVRNPSSVIFITDYHSFISHHWQAHPSCTVSHVIHHLCKSYAPRCCSDILEEWKLAHICTNISLEKQWLGPHIMTQTCNPDQGSKSFGCMKRPGHSQTKPIAEAESCKAVTCSWSGHPNPVDNPHGFGLCTAPNKVLQANS